MQMSNLCAFLPTLNYNDIKLRKVLLTSVGDDQRKVVTDNILVF